MDFEPQELLPAMPPMVHRAWVEGSTGKNTPCRRNSVFSAPSVMPGSTRTEPGGGIDLQHAAQELRAIHHQRPVHGLPALAGPASPGQHRDPGLARDRQSGGHVVDRLRHDHAQRFDLIDRGVGGVTAAAGAIEQHLAADFAAETQREGGDRRGGCRWWTRS